MGLVRYLRQVIDIVRTFEISKSKNRSDIYRAYFSLAGLTEDAGDDKSWTAVRTTFVDFFFGLLNDLGVSTVNFLPL